MPYDHIRVDREDRLTIVTIDRPAAHNALNDAATAELEHAFDGFAADDDQWIAIVTGSGEKAFCAGFDLKQQAALGTLPRYPKGFAGLTERYDLAKPMIAAVNGVALGGGFELALACDIVVAADHASFAVPEPRVGLAALGGGIQRLPREIGLKAAMGILLTGRRVPAREALGLGLVNEVVSGDVVAAARRWAAMILECSPMSVRATKDAVLRGLDMPVPDAVPAQWDYPAMRAMLASADAVEGPAAFVARRTPEWRGC